MKGYRLGTLAVALLIVAVLLPTFTVGNAPPIGLSGGASVAASAYTVASTADAGPGTLRQALLDAASGDTILFSATTFPPANPATITVSSALPPIIQDNLTLDASNVGVILDGSAAGGVSTPGLDIRANGVTVRGLHIVKFTGCGIELRGQHNTIGGDRQTGNGPVGQGNLISGNGICGIGMWEATTAYNVIRGNLIGVDASGLQAWGNQGDGVHINGSHHNLIDNNVISSRQGCGVKICCSPDSAYNTIRDNSIGVGVNGEAALPIGDKSIALANGANHNTVGPGNRITSGSYGVSIDGRLSPYNTILGNSIYANYESGISLWNESMDLVRVPAITSFDLTAGTVSGVACSNCLVQIYSDEDNEGHIYEGQAVADALGTFAFEKGTTLNGPHITATATDVAGTTSMFSVPTVGQQSFPLQNGNSHPCLLIPVRTAAELPDNRMSTAIQDQSWLDGGMIDATVLNRLGARWVHGAMNDPDQYLINWETDETIIHSSFDQLLTELEAHGIELTYILIFWDKEHYRETGEIILPRFETEEEIQRYLDFVRLMVRAFGDRVDYYELWNEPSWHDACLDPLAVQCIPLENYLELARRAIPVIREEDPGARIVIPSYHAWDPPLLYENYLYPILSSDLMPLVDVVAWHPFLVHLDPAECGGEFFTRYWSTVLPEIKALATAHGFQGQFRADDLKFPLASPYATATCAVLDRTAGKYYVRELLHHLGEDIAAGTHGVRDTAAQVVQRLATVMAGAQPESWPLEVETTASVLTYTFALPGGDRLAALWHTTPITDEDTIISVTLRLPGLAVDTMMYAIQVLDGYQQRLVTVQEAEELVLQDILLREYPLLIRIVPRRELYLPLIICEWPQENVRKR